MRERSGKTWDEWFAVFDERTLNFIYQESRKDGNPSTFFRLPWVSWKAPKALKADLKGPGLLALFADMATGSSDETAVLEAGCCINGSNLFVSAGAKRDAVDKLVNGG